MSIDRKAHMAALGANIIFAGNFTAIKLISPDFIKPFALNVVRVIVSVLLFWGLYLMKPSSAGIKKKDVGKFLICGATGVAINQMFFVKGMSLTTSIHGALLMLATPIFISFIAMWLLREQMNKLKIAGLGLGISGAAILISMREVTGSGSNILLGDTFVLINAISYAFYMVLVRPLMAEYSPIHALRWTFTFGAFMILPFGWNEFSTVNWQMFTLNAWIALTFIVIGATFFAYLLTVYSINKIGASTTGAYIYTQPVFATIIAVFVAGETITLYKILAGILILSGVLLVNKKQVTEEVN